MGCRARRATAPRRVLAALLALSLPLCGALLPGAACRRPAGSSASSAPSAGSAASAASGAPYRPGGPGAGRVARQALAAPSDAASSLEWRSAAGCSVVVDPSVAPRGWVHFAGGLGLGALPRVAYGPLLELLASRGLVVVATPVSAAPFSHEELAAELRIRFERAVDASLRDGWLPAPARALPVVAVGHSMGAKLLALGDSYAGLRGPGSGSGSGSGKFRVAGKVLISFNNFSAAESVPLLRAADPVRGYGNGALPGLPREFRPTPEKTWAILSREAAGSYLLLRFRGDELDQTRQLGQVLAFAGAEDERPLPATRLALGGARGGRLEAVLNAVRGAAREEDRIVEVAVDGFHVTPSRFGLEEDEDQEAFRAVLLAYVLARVRGAARARG